MSEEQDLDPVQRARRRLLRAGAYAAPAVLGALTLRPAWGAPKPPKPSCGPTRCSPNTVPCGPTLTPCNPNRGGS